MMAIVCEQAKIIAANPDGCSTGELRDLMNWIGTNWGSGLIAPATMLWGKAAEECLPLATETLGHLRSYCAFSIQARTHRLAGRIQRAIVKEQEAQAEYEQLAGFAKW